MVEIAVLAVAGFILLVSPVRSSNLTWSLSAHTLVGIGAAAVGVLLVFRPTQAPHLVVAGGIALGVLWLVRRSGRRRDARATSRAVQLVCAELADDLRAGRVPEDALEAAGARWPPLRPVVVASRLHHDVAQAFRDLAEQPGAAGLRDVAAAWRVSARAGSGLASALDQVAGLLSAHERRARLVDAELAAARATAAVVSGLPVLVLGMGAGLGTNPWSFFLGAVGVADLGLAGLLLIAGWAWLDWLAVRAVLR